MIKTVEAIYKEGILHPLKPLLLPEQARVQIQIIRQTPAIKSERQHARQALLKAGIIHPHHSVESKDAVSEAELSAAAHSLAMAGPISELIIADRDKR